MFISFVFMEDPSLTAISGINSSGLELLAAVGVEGSIALSRSEPGSLLEEMTQANTHLELVDELPELTQVTGWIDEARKLAGLEEVQAVTRLEEYVEMVPVQVVKAIQMSPEQILKNKISVADVPEMTEFLSKDELFEEKVVTVEGSRPVNVAVREIAPKETVAPSTAGAGNDGEEERQDSRVEPLKSNSSLDIRKTASPELNAGKKRHSESYIRGVLHPTPGRVKIGSIFALFTLILFPLNFVACGLVLTVLSELPAETKMYFLAIPGATVVFGFLYFALSRPVKCRVCGQPVFAAKRCRRNPKAHHIPVLGYIIPTIIHMLIFHWFRCMYCGSSIRLKK